MLSWQLAFVSLYSITRKLVNLLARGNKSVLDAFKSYACGEGAGYFVTDPSIALTATMAELREGCVNLRLRRNEWSTVSSTFLQISLLLRHLYNHIHSQYIA